MFFSWVDSPRGHPEGLPTPLRKIRRQPPTQDTYSQMPSRYCLVAVGMWLSRCEVAKRVRAVRSVKVLDDGYVVALVPAI